MTKKFNEKVCEFLWRPMYTCGINVSRIVRLPTSTACGPGIYKTSSVGGEEEKTYRNTKKKKKGFENPFNRLRSHTNRLKFCTHDMKTRTPGSNYFHKSTRYLAVI